MNISLEYLLDMLEERYPNKLPINKITIEELRIKQGEQQVITYLRGILEGEERRIHENKKS